MQHFLKDAMMNKKHSCPYPTKQRSLLNTSIFSERNPNMDAPLSPHTQLVTADSRNEENTTKPTSEAHGFPKKNNFYHATCCCAYSGSHESKSRHGPPRFIKLDSVADQAGMGKSTVLAWEATGRFPRAVRLSATLRLWLQEDVDNWIRDQHAKAKAGVQS